MEFVFQRLFLANMLTLKKKMIAVSFPFIWHWFYVFFYDDNISGALSTGTYFTALGVGV